MSVCRQIGQTDLTKSEENMATYKVTETIKLNPGVIIGLNKEQAAARAHCLESTRGNLFKVTAPVQFKAGEVISLVDPDKYVQTRIDEVKKSRKEKHVEAVTDDPESPDAG